MSDKADIDELARRYLDLWQDQMAAFAADPEVAETMNRLAAAAGASAPAAWAERRPAPRLRGSAIAVEDARAAVRERSRPAPRAAAHPLAQASVSGSPEHQ